MTRPVRAVVTVTAVAAVTFAATGSIALWWFPYLRHDPHRAPWVAALLADGSVLYGMAVWQARPGGGGP